MGRNSKSPCFSSARTDSPQSTSGSGEVVTSPKFMLFVRPFPSLWWLIIRSTSTRPPRRRSRTFSSPTTARSSLPTLGGTSPKSSVVPEPERVTRNLTVKAEKTLSQLHPRRKEEHFSHTHTRDCVFQSFTTSDTSYDCHLFLLSFAVPIFHLSRTSILIHSSFSLERHPSFYFTLLFSLEKK